jgi:hypothetical protein
MAHGVDPLGHYQRWTMTLMALAGVGYGDENEADFGPRSSRSRR